MARDLPEPIRRIVEGQGLEVWDLPIQNGSDEAVRRRREILGGPGLYASVLAEREGRIVVVRDAGKESLGGWTIPGGRVEPGEELEAAAVREAREESGLDVILTRPLAVGATAIVAPNAGRIESYDVVFEARVTGGSFRPMDPHEILEVRWASREDVEALVAKHGFENAHPFDHSLFRCVREYFANRIPG